MDTEYPKDEPLVQTYVWHEGKAFLVSTINRPSSAAASYGGMFAETIVWEWFSDKRERGAIIGQDSSGNRCLYAHQRMVERLYRYGRCEDGGTA